MSIGQSETYSDKAWGFGLGLVSDSTILGGVNVEVCKRHRGGRGRWRPGPDIFTDTNNDLAAGLRNGTMPHEQAGMGAEHGKNSPQARPIRLVHSSSVSCTPVQSIMAFALVAQSRQRRKLCPWSSIALTRQNTPVISVDRFQ